MLWRTLRSSSSMAIITLSTTKLAARKVSVLMPARSFPYLITTRLIWLQTSPWCSLISASLGNTSRRVKCRARLRHSRNKRHSKCTRPISTINRGWLGIRASRLIKIYHSLLCLSLSLKINGWSKKICPNKYLCLTRKSSPVINPIGVVTVLKTNLLSSEVLNKLSSLK